MAAIMISGRTNLDEDIINRPFSADATTEQLCEFFAGRLRAHRVRQNLTQADVAQAAGLGLRTYRRLEATGRGSIETLITVLKVTGRVTAVAILFPEPASASTASP